MIKLKKIENNNEEKFDFPSVIFSSFHFKYKLFYLTKCLFLFVSFLVIFFYI